MKISKEEYQYFKERVHHWIDKLSLHDYELDIDMEHLEDNDFAQCAYQYPGKGLAITITDKWDGNMQDNHTEYLDKIAHHEVTEGLLSEFRTMVPEQLAYKMDQIVHGVIHRLWKAMKEDKV